jgi:hypothetical protein
MYKITDILSLGTDYTVADRNGNILKTVQVITAQEILDAALGPYNEDAFDDYDSYLEKSIAVLSGFDEVDTNKILWYATIDEEVTLSDVIEYAIKNGYDKIILEHLEDLDLSLYIN